MDAHDELLRLLRAVGTEDRRPRRCEPDPSADDPLDEEVLGEIEAAARRVLARGRLRPPAPPPGERTPERDDVRAAAQDPGTFWAQIGDADRAELRAVAVARDLSAREVLFRTGTPATSVFVVVAGWVRVTAPGLAGQEEITVALRGPGELVGEAGALCGRPRSADVQALGGSVRVLEVGADVFSAFLEANPAAARLVERAASRRLRDANEQRRIITAASGEQRLAAVVCRLAERYGTTRVPPAPGPAGVGPHETSAVLVPVPVVVRDLASMCAVPPGTADGIARKWRRCGIAGFDGTGILLHRPPALRSLFDTAPYDVRPKAKMTREHRAIQAWEEFQRLQAGILDELERMPASSALPGLAG